MCRGIADIGVNAPVALFTFAVVGRRRVDHAARCRCGRLRRASLIDAFDGERTTSGRGALRARSALLVAQIALSVVLLVAAGLVVRSFQALRQVDLGFTPDARAQPDRAAAGNTPSRRTCGSISC